MKNTNKWKNGAFHYLNVHFHFCILLFWLILGYNQKDFVFQFSSVTQSRPTLCNPMHCSMLGLPVHHQLQEFTQTHAHWISDAMNHLILCRPLLLLPPIPPSIAVFSSESALCMRWPECWSLSFSNSPSNGHSLWPHELQHARPPCPSPAPGVHSNSHPSSQWCLPPSHPRSSPSPPAPNPSQHQSLFQWVSSPHQVAKVLEFQLQHQSLQWTLRTDLL